jgi:hypothetical protein
VRCRKSGFTEESKCIFPKVSQPDEVATERRPLKLSEAFEVGFYLLHCCRHYCVPLISGRGWHNSPRLPLDPSVTLRFEFER